MFFFRFTAGWSDQPVRAALLFYVPEIVRDRNAFFGRIRPDHSTTLYPGVAQLVARLLWEQDGASSVARTSFLRKTTFLGVFLRF